VTCFTRRGESMISGETSARRVGKSMKRDGEKESSAKGATWSGKKRRARPAIEGLG